MRTTVVCSSIIDPCAASIDPSREIVDLFSELNLSQDAAQRLIDPDGEYGYSDLVSLGETLVH